MGYSALRGGVENIVRKSGLEISRLGSCIVCIPSILFVKFVECFQ